MLDDLISNLSDPDPAVRRRAITALAQSRNPDALTPLARIHRHDPDPTLRELALTAGRYIRQYAAPPSPPPESSLTLAEPAPVAVAASEAAIVLPQEVTSRDRELARSYLDSATGYFTGDDKGRAVENLGKALSLNPELSKETFVVNLTANLTGRSIAEVLPQLIHPDRREELIATLGGKKKLKRKQEHGEGVEKATWDQVLADIGLYWLVNAIVLVVSLVIFIDAIQEFVNNLPSTTSGTPDASDLDYLWTASILGLIVMALFYSILNIIGMAIQLSAIHVAAVYVLAGNGTLVYLLRRVIPFYTLASLVGGGLFVLLAISGEAVSVWFLAPMVLTVGVVVVAYVTANIIAEVYGFGWWSGCGAIVIGSFLLLLVNCAVNFLLFAVLGAIFGAS